MEQDSNYIENCKQWDKTGLLKRFDDAFKPVVAATLQSQRTFNEGLDDSYETALFKRTSIPLLVRIMEGLSPLRSIIKGRLAGALNVKMHTFDNIEGFSKRNPLEQFQWIWAPSKLDIEAEMVAVLNEKLTHKITEFLAENQCNVFYLRGVYFDENNKMVMFYELE